jgi:23S rRNA pseudouridine1911/1915/1917 synthase
MQDSHATWPQRFTVTPEQAGQRLDVFLAEQLPAFSRSLLRRSIDAGHVHVDNNPCKASLRLDPGNTVVVTEVAAPREGPKPQNIPLNILFEDDGIIVVDKRAGMIVHPAKGHWEGTLASALAHHFGNSLSSVGGPTRPGIVHRLDRETSGVIVVAKTDQAHDALAAQFKSREVKKEYLAIVLGMPDRDRDVVDEPIGDHPANREKKAIRRQDPIARPAVTVYETIERFAGFAFVRALPRTGRTHQIRLHLAHIRHPVLCDKLYGGRNKITELELIPPSKIGHDDQQAYDKTLLNRHALHAYKLTITNPTTGQLQTFEAPLHADMDATLVALRKWRTK